MARGGFYETRDHRYRNLERLRARHTSRRLTVQKLVLSLAAVLAAILIVLPVGATKPVHAGPPLLTLSASLSAPVITWTIEGNRAGRDLSLDLQCYASDGFRISHSNTRLSWIDQHLATAVTDDFQSGAVYCVGVVVNYPQTEGFIIQSNTVTVP